MKTATRPKCAEEGCTVRPYKGYTKCSSHRTRQPRRIKMPRQIITCDVEACDVRPIKLGYSLCARHRPCAVDGCTRYKGEPGRFCTHHLMRKRKYGSPTAIAPGMPQDVDRTDCRQCGVTLQSERVSFVFCSRDCKREHDHPTYTRVCEAPNCESHFRTTFSTKRFCSNKCKQWVVNVKHRERRNDYNLKMVVLANNPNALCEDITRQGVFKRDNWRCQICGDAIDRDAKRSRMSGVVDHIIPPKYGGNHTWSNVQAAHSSCNVSKGDRLVFIHEIEDYDPEGAALLRQLFNYWKL